MKKNKRLMRSRLHTLLTATDEEDDGLHIGWPVAMLLNVTGVILLVVLLAKWTGCG